MDNVLIQIKKIAINYTVEKVVLFGSRARGDHTTTSDYDIGIFGNNLSDIEEVETLKKIDILFVKEDSVDELMENIKREGVVIHEQI
jgi:predicted nucleotidyltransferase